jgi:histidine ammonia-lyase
MLAACLAMTLPHLDGHALGLQAAWAVAEGARPAIRFAAEAEARVQAARDLVERVVAEGRTVYGITTGFGRLKDVAVPASEVRRLQRNLLLSHAVGVGPAAGPPVVRLLLLFRIQTLLRGHSGIRLDVLRLLSRFLEEDLLPVVPTQGSVGASGDLAPLAHLALPLIGEGAADLAGARLLGREALRRIGAEPIVLEAKEGLALINGTQFTSAVAAEALRRAFLLAASADLACALSLEAWQGSLSPCDPRVAALRPHPGHAASARNILRIVGTSQIQAAHRDCGRVQDPYSFRCAPQVHGAVRDALQHTAQVLTREINAATDNPLVFPEEGETLSAGNFHGEPLALPCDYAAAAMAELGSISERRIENLVNPDLSRLPAFLAGGQPGLDSGLMMAQVTAAALVSENKCIAHPASVDSIPTSANQEDHVSMSPIAARHLEAIVENVTTVLAIELLAGHLALHWRRPLRSGPGVEAADGLLATVVPPPGPDRAYGEEIASVRELIRSGRLIAAVEAAVGPLERGPDP